MHKQSRLVAVSPIRTEADLTAALAKIEALMDAAPGSHDALRLEVLSTLVEAYEAKHHPISPPAPIDAIRFRLEQQGLTTKALEGIIGTRARVSEVLNGKRALSLAMIRKLHAKLGIPLASLIGAAR
jgi:HTH-type transcriptional regulator/antitoxin HigA